MDNDEIRKFKLLLFVVLAFLFSCWTSWQEFKYLAWGQETEAKVRRVFETRERRRDLLAIEFSYQDEEGQHLEERDDVPYDTDVPEAGGTITIQYIQGAENSARLAGQASMGGVIFFFICLAVMLFFGIKVFREAHQAVHGGPRRAGSRR